MIPEFDVAIVGGAFSGAATALLIKRRRPDARILIIEKAIVFDRKVGESTTEVSSCFLTKVLGLTSYLGHEQLAKQGLRLWFANRPDPTFRRLRRDWRALSGAAAPARSTGKNSTRICSTSRSRPGAKSGMRPKYRAATSRGRGVSR
jgi:2-polyprenyl-6-methoxyphenol hydroxylase-like FAD-dependent oxidoreductase